MAVAGPHASRLHSNSKFWIAVLGICALTWIGLASPARAAATDSYSAPTFAVGDNPGGVAFTPDGSKAVVVTADPDLFEGRLSIIDAATHSTIASVPAGVSPNGVAVSPDGDQAFVASMGNATNGGQVSVVNLTDGTLTKQVSEGSVWDVAYSPDGSKVFEVVPEFGSDHGHVQVIDPHTLGSSSAIYVGQQPESLVFSPDGTKAFVVNSGDGIHSGSVSVIDVAAEAVSATIPVGVQASSIAISADGSTLFVANYGDGVHEGTVSVIDVASNTVTNTVNGLGIGPGAIKVTPDGSQAYVLGEADGTVSVIDVATLTVSHRFSVGGQPWNLAFSPDGSEAWVTIDGTDQQITGSVAVIDTAIAGWSPTVRRISGADRYSTSVAVSQAAYPTSASTVFVATGMNFPDALSAAAAAAHEDGPLLLTAPGELPDVVKTEIERLRPSRIVVVGGPSAVSESVLSSLRSLAATVTRVSGSDRYATSRAIVDKFFGSSITKTYVATGLNFPDALSASAAAGAHGVPVLLVNGASTTLDPSARQFLVDHGTNSYTIVGGPNAVSVGVETALSVLGATVRLSGATRYETSELINRDAFEHPDAAYFATGLQFPDALSGAVLAAESDAPLYVVLPSCVPSNSEHDLAVSRAANATLIGGTSALEDSVLRMTNC